jgi:hypothetical protein
MGIERKNPNINWLASFGLIILAGTFYRFRKINKKLMQAKIQDLMNQAGMSVFSKNKPNIYIPSEVKMEKGEWEQALKNRSHFKTA